MINWKFDPTQYQENALIAPGEYRVRIDEAQETLSKTGKEMIKMTLAVSGSNVKIFYYLVFLPEYPEMTNNRLGQIFNSFGIAPNDFNLDHWTGKAGGAQITNEEDSNGEKRNAVKRFLSQAKTATLPAWQDEVARSNINPDMVNFDGADIPF